MRVGDDGEPLVDGARSGLRPSSAFSIYRDCCRAVEFFSDRRGESLPVDQIRPEDVDRYVIHLIDGGLKRGTSRTIAQRLVAVLDLAGEREHVARNVAVGPVKRVKPEKVRKPSIERAEQIEAMLSAARPLDAEKAGGIEHRQAFIATLLFTGARIGEALAIRWADVDLAGGSIRSRGTKTTAADRWVDLLPALRDDLADLSARVGRADPFGVRPGDRDRNGAGQ